MPTPYRILSDDTLNLLAARGDAQALMELGYRAERLAILAEAQELAKRLREGKEVSDCKHCDHLTAYWEDTAGKHDRWQCCHCGRIREHGPFLRDPDHDCAAPDCLDDRDMPAFLRPQAG